MMRSLVVGLICFSSMVSTVSVAEEEVLPYGEIDKSLLPIAYSGQEKLVYDVCWNGGIKIGELTMEIKRPAATKDIYEIHARVTTDNGMFSLLYPVEDVHKTTVAGDARLPVTYEVWQKEGWNYEAHRYTEYDQQQGTVRYRKNEDPVVEYVLDGTAHNEFSSFFSSRLMELAPGNSFLVSTFADHKRNKVVVQTKGLTTLEDTILGDVETLEVMPIMKFEGLYDKSGDTVIWYTNDECRVPVQVNSKIVVGSLTSTLVSYSNPACTRYSKINVTQQN